MANLLFSQNSPVLFCVLELTEFAKLWVRKFLFPSPNETSLIILVVLRSLYMLSQSSLFLSIVRTCCWVKRLSADWTLKSHNHCFSLLGQPVS